MEFLNKKTVRIKDRSHLENVVAQLIEGGASQLQVIADFDHTLSRVHKNGVTCATTHGIIKTAPCITEEYRRQANRLFQYFSPIENDPYLSKAEKIPYMTEWYSKSRNLMPLSGISKDKIPEIVKSSNVCLRDGCEQLFKSLNTKAVPLLIFSAGIGDVLQEVLIQQQLLLPNIKIISNFMQFDETGQFFGYKNDVIHPFNKNHSSIENSDYFHALKNRTNIILLGDSAGDIDMSEGATNVNTILKIGFLNHRIEESLPQFLNLYDIVLADDQTMDIANGILEIIFQ